MSSIELIANLFRISQTEEKLKKDKVHSYNCYTLWSWLKNKKSDRRYWRENDRRFTKIRKSIKQIEKEELKIVRNNFLKTYAKHAIM